MRENQLKLDLTLFDQKIVNKKYLSMSGNEANPPRDMMKHKLGSCPIMFKLTYSKRVLFLVKNQVAW